LTLRVVILEPTWRGPVGTVRDQPLGASVGESFVRKIPPGSVVRLAIGFLEGPHFLPVAQASALEMPPIGPLALTGRRLLRWTPAGPSYVEDDAPEAEAIREAARPIFMVSAALSRAVEPHRDRSAAVVAAGSSEHSARTP
jgi:hypothetical protein